MLGRCGTAASDCRQRLDARRGNPGRVTRSSIVLRIVAVDARDRVDTAGHCLQHLVRVPVGQLADALEALLDLRCRGALRERLTAELAVERHDGRMAMEAVARLLRLARHVALGDLLVLRACTRGRGGRGSRRRRGSLRTAAGATGRARLLRREAALGTNHPAAVLGACRLSGALVAVVLAGPVGAPLLRVDVSFGELDQLEVGALCLLLSLEDIDEQRDRQRGDDSGDDRDDRVAGGRAPAGRPGRGLLGGGRFVHGVLA